MAKKEEIEAAQKTIDKLDHDAEKQLKKIDGGTFKTESNADADVKGDWKEYTWEKASLKIEGGYLRVQLGPSDTVVHGFKGEYVTPLSIGYIAGIEKKTVVGLAQTRIDGAKSDDIGGGKIDNLLGIKYEKKAKEEIKVGPSPGLRNELVANDKMDSLKEKFGTAASKLVNWLWKADENSETIGSLSKDISTLTKQIDDCKEAGSTYAAKLKEYKESCASNTDLKASDIVYDCNGFQVKASGSDLNMFPSSECTIMAGSSRFTCGGSYVSMSGSKIFYGKSF
jgi:hypothetical protein